MNKYYSIQQLADVIAALRGENGCPWDREQTHNSLRPCIMEEAAELLAAIRIYEQSGDPENMQEELGDILLMVVMHAQIADEEGIFDLQNVIDGIGEKMIRRHPHVFSGVKAEDSDAVLKNWEEIKKKEKEGKAWIESPLREIPRELPALTRASKILKKADALYGGGRDVGQNIEILESSVKKLRQPEGIHEKTEFEQIMGDMLMCMADLARLSKVSQEQILTDRIENLIEELEPDKKC